MYQLTILSKEKPETETLRKIGELLRDGFSRGIRHPLEIITWELEDLRVKRNG